MAAWSAPLAKEGLIFLGAGSGGVLRYWIGELVQSWWGARFPGGTMAVNVSGCLVMGVLLGVWGGAGHMREELRAAVLIGLLGGYTTFSSFGRDALLLVQDGQWWRAAMYVAGSVGACLLAVWAGAAAGARLV